MSHLPVQEGTDRAGREGPGLEADGMVGQALAILGLILVNGFFSGSEIALVSLRRSEVQRMVARGIRRARRIAALQDAPIRLFATVQVGVTLVGSLASVLGGAALVDDIASSLRHTGVRFLASHAEGLAIALVVGGISYVSLVLGELVPKSLGQRYRTLVALNVAPLLFLLSRILWPLVALLTRSSNLVLRLFRDRTTFVETRLTLDEVRMVLEEGTRTGVIEPEQSAMMEGVIDLPTLDARHAMIPRVDVQAVPADIPPETLREVLLTTPHDHLPVFGKDLDDIRGVIRVPDALRVLAAGGSPELDRLLQPAVFVPELMDLDTLLRKMLAERVYFMIVVDEFGGTAGVVTLEDILEEIVGDIPPPGAAPSPPPIERQPDGSAIVAGHTPVRDVNDELGLDLQEEGPFETIGGLLTHLAGEIPAQGQVFHFPTATVEVVSRTEKRVGQVRIVPHPPG